MGLRRTISVRNIYTKRSYCTRGTSRGDKKRGSVYHDVPHRGGEAPLYHKVERRSWQGAQIPIIGTYTLTWYNEAMPNERHTEQETVTTEMIEPYGEEDFLENVIPLILLIRPLMVFMLL